MIPHWYTESMQAQARVSDIRQDQLDELQQALNAVIQRRPPVLLHWELPDPAAALIAEMDADACRHCRLADRPVDEHQLCTYCAEHLDSQSSRRAHRHILGWEPWDAFLVVLSLTVIVLLMIIGELGWMGMTQ